MVNEYQIEQDFIEKLVGLKYTYNTSIKNKKTLNANFKAKFEALNNVFLDDEEFTRLLADIIDSDVYESARRLRENGTLQRTDGSFFHYILLDTKDWCRNEFEVINQLTMNTSESHHRYDVIILLNGIPIVQTELKTLAINPRSAMQQIVRYKNDDGNGYTNSLLCFIQLFIVSNMNDTWYFANNNKEHFQFNADERFLPMYQFAAPDNKKITHLPKFANAFLEKCKLAELVSRYMVLVATERKMLIMRPYQMYAVKAIMDSIKDNCGNGYIWHTTGSGKTLTSFKASTLMKENPHIEKCLFVVDRKDLDRQTRDEFNKFQENCVEENTNTKALVDKLISDNYSEKVIVTTIQKLSLALSEPIYKEQLKDLGEKRVAFIFDECHRSQFGENHKRIKEFFPNSQLFGFTGTPIFEENATYKKIDGNVVNLQTTEDIFPNELHKYTITHAIEDRNVLRFNVDYYQPKEKKIVSEKIRKQAVLKEILEKHSSATFHRKFNAIFATSSIMDAMEYYTMFKDADHDLNIACVFSPPSSVSAEVRQLQEDLAQEKEDNKTDPDKKKTALTAIIEDYNAKYGTNHCMAEFDDYYKDVQSRIKSQKYPNAEHPQGKKIDIVIVCDMLLTGFDSQYLNTLYVDKNLKYHGLIQAFSRTNRILNDSKPNGNILDFCGQKDRVNEAIALFSGKSGAKDTEIWFVDPAPKVIERMKDQVQKLKAFMEEQNLEFAPSEIANVMGDTAKANFVNLFREVQKSSIQLGQYTSLTEEEKQIIEDIIPQDALKGFRERYLEVAKKLSGGRDNGGKTTPEAEQLQFDFVIFSSAQIDYDFIMNLTAEMSGATPEKQKMCRDELVSLISSDAKFMDNKDDLIAYIDTLQTNVKMTVTEIKDGFIAFVQGRNNTHIAELAAKHGLDAEVFDKYVKNVIKKLVFDSAVLRDTLFEGRSFKEKNIAVKALMEDLVPFLEKQAQGQKIEGLVK